MAVFCKRVNGAQRRALNDFESISGFEPMFQEDLDAGEITFSELWARNQSWFELVCAAVQNIPTHGCGMLKEQP